MFRALLFLLLLLVVAEAINGRGGGLSMEPLGKADMLQRHADFAQILVLEDLKSKEEPCDECENAKIALETKLMIDEQVAENFKNMAAQAKANALNAIKNLILEQNVKISDLYTSWKDAEQTFLDHLQTLNDLKEDVVQKATSGVTSKKIIDDANAAVLEELSAAKLSYKDLDLAKENYVNWLQHSLIEAQKPFDTYSKSLVHAENLIYSTKKGITDAQQLYKTAYSISNKYPFNDSLKQKASDAKDGLDNAVSNFESAKQNYQDQALILVEASNQLMQQSNKIATDIQYVSNEAQRISDKSRDILLSSLHEADKSINLVKTAATANKKVNDAVEKLKNTQATADHAKANVDQIKSKFESSSKALDILNGASKTIGKLNGDNLIKLQNKIGKLNNEISNANDNLNQLKREYNRAKADAAVSNSALLTSKSDDLLMAESNRDELCSSDSTSDNCKNAKSSVEELTPDSLKLLIQASQKDQDKVDSLKQKVSDAQDKIDSATTDLQSAKLEQLNSPENVIGNYVDEVSNELASLKSVLDEANENLKAAQDALKEDLNALRSVTPSGIATSDLVNQISINELICDSLVSDLASQAALLQIHLKASNDQINVLTPQLQAGRSALSILSNSGVPNSNIQEAQDAVLSLSNLINKETDTLNEIQGALNDVSVSLLSVLPPSVKVEDFLNNLVAFYQTINDKNIINLVEQLRNTQDSLNQQNDALLKASNRASNDVFAVNRLSDQLKSAQSTVSSNTALLNVIKPENLIGAENKVEELKNEISNACDGGNHAEECSLLQNQLMDAIDLVNASTPMSLQETLAAMDNDKQLVVDLTQKLKDANESSSESLNDLKSSQSAVDKSTQSLNDIVIALQNIIPLSLDTAFVVNFVSSGSNFLSDKTFPACSGISFQHNIFADGKSDNVVNGVNSKVTDLHSNLFGSLLADAVDAYDFANKVTDDSGVLAAGVSSTLSSLVGTANSIVSEAQTKVSDARDKVDDLQSVADANPSCLTCIDDVNNAKEDLAAAQTQVDNASVHLSTVQNVAAATDPSILQLLSCKQSVLRDISSAIVSVQGFQQLFLSGSAPSNEDISSFISTLREQVNQIKQDTSELECPGVCNIVSVDPIVAVVANIVIQAQNDLDSAKSNADSLQSQIDNSNSVINSIQNQIADAQASNNNDDVISSLNNQLNIAKENYDSLLSSMNISQAVLSSAQTSLYNANDKLASVIPGNVDISQVLNSVIASAPYNKACNIQNLASAVASRSLELHQMYSDKMETLSLIATIEKKLSSDPQVIELTNMAVEAQIALNSAKSVLSDAQQALRDAGSDVGSRQEAVDEAKANVKYAESQIHLAFKALLASMPVGVTYKDAVDATNAEIEFRALKNKNRRFVVSVSDKSLNELKSDLASITDTINSLSTDLAVNQKKFNNCADDLGISRSDVHVISASSDPVISKHIAKIQKKTDLLNKSKTLLDNLKSDIDDLNKVIESLNDNLERSKLIKADDNAALEALNVANNRLSDFNDKLSIANSDVENISADLESAKSDLGSALPSGVSIDDVVSSIVTTPLPPSVFSIPTISTSDLVNDISNSQQNLDATVVVTEHVNSQINSLLQAIQDAQTAVSNSNSDSLNDAVADLKEKQDSLSQLQDTLHDAIQSQQAARAKLNTAVANFGSAFPSGAPASDPYICHLVDEIVQSKPSLDNADLAIHVAEKALIYATSAGIDVDNKQQAYNDAVASRRYIEFTEHHLFSLLESVTAGSKFEKVLTVCNSLTKVVSDPVIIDLISKNQRIQVAVAQTLDKFNELSDTASYSSNIVKNLQAQSNSVSMTNQAILDDANNAEVAYLKLRDEVQTQKDKAQDLITAAQAKLDITKSYFQKSFPSGVPATSPMLCSAIDQFRQSTVDLDKQELAIHLASRKLYDAQKSGIGVPSAQTALDDAKNQSKTIELTNHHLLEVLTMMNPNVKFEEASSLCESVSGEVEDPIIVELISTFQLNQDEVAESHNILENISDSEVKKLQKASELAAADARIAQKSIDEAADQLNSAISQYNEDSLARDAAKDDLDVQTQNLSMNSLQIQAAIPDNVDVSHVVAVVSSVNDALRDPKVAEVIQNLQDLRSSADQVVIESEKASNVVKNAEKNLETLQQELDKLKGDAKEASAEIEEKRSELEKAVYSGAGAEGIFAIQDEIEKKSAAHDKIQTSIIEKARKSVAASKAVEDAKSTAHDILGKQVKIQSDLKDTEKSLKLILPGPVSVTTVLTAPPRLDCPSDCNGQGDCSISGVCSCKEGFGGNDCSLEFHVCPGKINNDVFCNGNGKCSFSGECNCHNGFRGADCSLKQVECPGQIGTSYCSGHGLCLFSGICDCDESHRGSDCRIAVVNDAILVAAAVNSLTEQFNNAVASNTAATGGDGEEDAPTPSISVPAIDKETKVEEVEKIFTSMCNSIPELLKRKHDAEIHIHKAHEQIVSSIENDFLSKSKYLQVYKEANQIYQFAFKGCNAMCEHLPQILKRKEEVETHMHFANDQLEHEMQNDFNSNPKYLDNYNEAIRMYEVASSSCMVLQVPTTSASIFDTYPLPTTKEPFSDPYPFVLNTIDPLTEPTEEPTVVFKLVLPTDVPTQSIIDDSLVKDVKLAIDSGLVIASTSAINLEDATSRTNNLDQIVNTVCSSLPELIKRKEEAEIYIHKANNENQNGLKNDLKSNSHYIAMYNEAAQFYDVASRNCDLFKGHLEGSKQDVLNLLSSSPQQPKYLK